MYIASRDLWNGLSYSWVDYTADTDAVAGCGKIVLFDTVIVVASNVVDVACDKDCRQLARDTTRGERLIVSELLHQ